MLSQGEVSPFSDASRRLFLQDVQDELRAKQKGSVCPLKFHGSEQ